MIFINLNLNNTIRHEYAHKAIAENFGCEEYSLDIKIDGSGQFECEKYLNGYDKEKELFLHSQNEIVSYNISSVIRVIEIGIIIFLNLGIFLKYKE